MRLDRALITATLAACLSIPTVSWSDSDLDTQEQINYLKDEILILQDQLEETNLANSNEMKISGYADIEYHNNSSKDSEPGFRLHHMSLFFEKHISDQWKFFSETEYEDAPFLEFKHDNTDSTCKGCYGKIFLEAVNFTYSPSSQLNVRGGRFFTPAGIWSVDHYPSFTPTQLRPEHIRNIFPQVVDGVSLFGTIPLGSTFANYDIYAGNGEGNSGKKDLNSEKAIGAKLSFLMPQLKYFEFGMSSYHDTLYVDPTNNIDKVAVGTHLKIKAGNFTFQSEYATGTYRPTTGAEYDSVGYYFQTLYDIDKWTVGLRHDFYDADESAQKDKTFNSVFFNYQVNPSIVLKLEHHSVEDEDTTEEDYDHTIGSIVLYLGN